MPRFRDQIEADVRVLFADAGRTWRVSRLKKPTLTAESAETAEKDLDILGDLCELCG